jgi:hypothetical protein
MWAKAVATSAFGGGAWGGFAAPQGFSGSFWRLRHQNEPEIVDPICHNCYDTQVLPYSK